MMWDGEVAVFVVGRYPIRCTCRSRALWISSADGLLHLTSRRNSNCCWGISWCLIRGIYVPA